EAAIEDTRAADIDGLAGRRQSAARHMVRDVEQTQRGAEVGGREIEGPRAASLAEAQAQRARAERRKVEADALPMCAVAVELGDDVARLAPRSKEDARELGVDDERRLVVA